jgi:DNA-binding response OmpR family regulator
MVIDDEKDCEFVLALTLQDQGYTVDSFNDAIRALTEFKPDISYRLGKATNR